MENSYTRNSKTSSETAENFVNKGLKNMVVVSDDYVGIESIGEMAIYGDNINIVGKTKDIRIEASGDIRVKGKKIHNNWGNWFKIMEVKWWEEIYLFQ